MQEITVKVAKYSDRKYFLMYYDCPVSGKRTSRSTRKTTRREAEREAAKWEDQLRAGRYKPAARISWEEFRERYERDVLASLAERTQQLAGTVFRAVEETLRPQKLAELTSERLSHFQSELREGDRSEATVRSYLAHLKAALKWAHDMELLVELPKIKMPKRAKGSRVMKGRAITLEEFERMLVKIEAGLLAHSTRHYRYKAADAASCGEEDGRRTRRFGAKAMARQREAQRKAAAAAASTWRHFLEGLWLSGLRIGEALVLSWDDPTKIVVDLTGRRPLLRIRSEHEKGGKDRLLPITPDFEEFLLETPEGERHGFVFRPTGMRGRICRGENWCSRIVSEIGQAAGVKVRDDGGKVKFASAHDLRRAFGVRWAPLVMPAVLQQMMRHESIDTTMKYYVGHNAEAMADALWKAAGVNTSVNSRPSSSFGSEADESQDVADSEVKKCSPMDSNHQPAD